MNKEKAIQKNEMILKSLLFDLRQTAIALNSANKGRSVLRHRMLNIEQVILMSFRLAQTNNGQQLSDCSKAAEQETK